MSKLVTLSKTGLCLFICLSIFQFSFQSVSAQETESTNAPDSHQLLWTMYSGISGYDKMEASACDLYGNIYTTGYITSANGTYWPFLNSFNGGTYDAYLAKMDRFGNVTWSIMIGGSANDYGTAVSLTPDGNIIVAGNTSSSDNITLNNPESAFGGGLNDGFVAEITPEGNFMWSRYVGGSGDDYINDIYVGWEGGIHVCGKTGSQSIAYTTAIQPQYGGGISDGYMCVLDPQGLMSWYTYIGGTDDDEVKDITLDETGHILVCGYGTSIPVISAISPNAPQGGDADAFVAAIDYAGQLAWATYVGGTGNDVIDAIDADQSGNILVTGYTTSGPLPGLGPVNQPTPGDQDAFIICYSGAGATIWGNYIGGSGQDTATDLHVDYFGNIYVSGHTSSSDLTIQEAFQIINRGGFDGFISKWSAEGDLLWSSYAGGTQDDFTNHLIVDRFGKMYLSGHTYSNDFYEIIPGNEYESSCEGFMMKLSDCNNPVVTIHTPEDSVFCYGSDVTLIACGALHYDWINGDTTMTTSVDTTMRAWVIGHNVPGCYAMSNNMEILALESPIITAFADGPTTFCGEGMVTLFAEGADSIRWTNGIEGPMIVADTADTYVAVGIAENGCRGASDPIDVIWVEMPEIQMAIAEDVMCVSDEPVAMIALPEGGMFVGPGTEEYGQFNPFTAGGGIHEIYYTWMDENGCFGLSDTISVNVMYYPTVIFAAEDTMCIFDPAIQLSGSPAGGIFEGDGVVGSVFTPASSGTGPQNIIYSYVDNNGCTNIAQSVIWVDACINTTEIEHPEEIVTFYPNPANDHFTIDYSGHQFYMCYLYSSTGSLVRAFTCNERTIINSSDLPTGIYTLKIISDERIKTTQLAVQH